MLYLGWGWCDLFSVCLLTPQLSLHTCTSEGSLSILCSLTEGACCCMFVMVGTGGKWRRECLVLRVGSWVARPEGQSFLRVLTLPQHQRIFVWWGQGNCFLHIPGTEGLASALSPEGMDLGLCPRGWGTAMPECLSFQPCAE